VLTDDTNTPLKKSVRLASWLLNQFLGNLEKLGEVLTVLRAEKGEMVAGKTMMTIK